MTRWLPFMPPDASTTASQVDALFLFLLISTGIVTLAIFTCLIVFSIKYRRRPGNEVARQIVGSWKLETAWTLLPLGLAMIPFYWGSTLYFDLASPPDDALNVYVVARQWMWKVEHPDGQAEIDELHVPVGQPVRLTMISQDVIHSFFVPAFRVKMDVLPGRYTTVWFEATAPGHYRIQCAEYCGTDHAQMLGWVVAMDPAEFADWLATQSTQSLASQGERLFQQLGCNGCHRVDSLARAPMLNGLYGQPVRLQDGSQVIADDAYLRDSVLNPSAQVVDGWQPIMPTFQGQLSEEELVALIAYLRSIGPGAGAPPPQPRPSPPPRPPVEPARVSTPSPVTGPQSLASQGDRLFQQFGCNGCHRADNLGPAPSLVGLYGQTVRLQDGSQVIADEAYVRNSILNPSAQVVDGWQPIMPSFQGQLSEEQLLALIAYVRSIGPGPDAALPQPSPSLDPARPGSLSPLTGSPTP